MATEDKNEALLDEILDLLGSPDCITPEVMLLIGKSGAGKSSLINTIRKVLTGKYYVIAEHGSGEARTTWNWYENCDVLPHRIADEHRREKMLDKLKRLPHIWDFPGLPDENSRKLREIIELLLGGYIPPGTSILALEDLQMTYGVGGLKKVFSETNPAWRVTKIVFMQGCIDAIAKNILECLTEILNMYDVKTLKKKYQCGLFVLITKYDLVKDSNDAKNLDGVNKDRMISLNDLETVEQEIAQQLCFKGAIQSKTIRWVSLTDNVGLENSYVENCALSFLKKMIEPGVPQAENTRQVIGIKPRIVLEMHRFGQQISEFCQQDIHINFPKVLICVVMIAVLAYLYSLLKQTAAESSPTTAGNISSGMNQTNDTKY